MSARALTLAPCLAALTLLAPGCRNKAASDADTNAAAIAEQDPAADAGADEAARDSDPPPATSAGPKLVLVIVVDQMRADYLERFDDQFEHGFRRLLDEGRVFTQASHQHAMTETAPGHATIVTGTPPSTHGIISNSWYDPAAGETITAVEDRGETIFGHEDAIGLSPSRLLREGVGDWMQAADPESVVVSISLKDRAAILLGGKRPDAAIWYDDSLGAYTSSSYYGEAVPAWVERYNALDRAKALYGDEGWTLMYGPERYAASRAQTKPELVTTYHDYALTKRFPHVIAVEGKQPRHVMRDTPFGDRMTVELALATVTTQKMGRDASPDLLLLSLSGGDYAGHRYGPGSIEIHDYYLHLDEALGDLLTELDNALGSDAYVALLTSDHGVAPMPEYGELASAGRFVGNHELPAMLAAAAEAVGLASDQIPAFVYSHGPHLQFVPELDEATRAEFRAALATVARAHPLVADAWTREELLGTATRNDDVRAWRRSFHPDRSPDVLVQLEQGVATHPEGTGHGTPYPYDQHVPLIVLGAGAPGTTYAEPVHVVDIAPTIATLVGVSMPKDLDGQPLPLE